MHCPNCGAAAALSQKFCRSCGFSLTEVAQLLDEQSLPNRPEPVSSPRWLLAGMLGTVILGLSGFSLLIIDQVIRQKGEPVSGAALLLLLWGAAFFGSLFMWSAMKQKALPDRRATHLPVADDTAKLLHERREVAQTITEHTTDLLAVPAPRKRSDELAL